MSRLCLYYQQDRPATRWFPGDHFLRSFIRRIVKGKRRYDGVDRTFVNLCLGLDKLGVPYTINPPFSKLHPHDRVAVFGRGKDCLKGYNRSIPIVAGVGLMNHPGEWPELFQQYPIKTLLQPSRWTVDLYKNYFKTPQAISLWATGIQTDHWSPKPDTPKDIDVLIYDKIRWNRENTEEPRASFMEELVRSRNLRSSTLKYGDYTPKEYEDLLARSRAMIFLCEHESQGLAYQEALSCNVPVLAWDNGYCLSPAFKQYSEQKTRATSVPYFDFRCGMKFKKLFETEDTFDEFWSSVITSAYTPREYILENLTLERCAGEFLNFFEL